MLTRSGGEEVSGPSEERGEDIFETYQQSRCDVSIFAPFVNTRVEIIHGGGKQKAYGWLTAQSSVHLVVECTGTPEFLPNEPVLVRLQSVDHSLACLSTFMAVRDGVFTFAPPPQLVKQPGNPSARVRGAVQDAQVDSEEGVYMTEIFDISESGISLRVLDPVVTSARLKVTVLVKPAPFHLIIEVSYCRAEEDGTYRVGGPILDMGRVDKTRWRDLIRARGKAA